MVLSGIRLLCVSAALCSHVLRGGRSSRVRTYTVECAHNLVWVSELILSEYYRVRAASAPGLYRVVAGVYGLLKHWFGVVVYWVVLPVARGAGSYLICSFAVVSRRATECFPVGGMI